MRQSRRPTRQVHCWVLCSVSDGQAEQQPGLVVSWRREGAGWAALAAWPRGGGFVVAWVDAEQVSPLAPGDDSAARP